LKLDIDGWLRGIGFAQYAEMFRANDIDIELLGRLTNDDLKDIGVVSLGHRKKLLEAIADLRSAPAAAPAPPPVMPAPIPATVAPPPISAPFEVAGERRHLTVMFCDLVGSTGISAQLDAEEWRDLVGAYIDAASAAVMEMGGHVAKKLGDGLMSLFGYPVAQENDSERAVRAALAIQRALAELNRKNSGSVKPSLAARIGLETGPVVVDAAGEIFGDVPNIAARVRRLPSRARSWSRRGCSAKSLACSLPRSAAAAQNLAKPRTRSTRSPPVSPNGGQRDQHCSCRSTYPVWREPMRNSVNSMTLGAASARR
jgi:hypothetical protein